MLTLDYFTVGLLLLLAALVGALLALLIAFRTVSRAFHNNLTIDDIRVLMQVAKRTQRASQLHPDHEEDYLQTLQNIIASNVGGAQDILVLEQGHMEVEVVESPVSNVQLDLVESMISTLDERSIQWFDRHYPESRLLDGRSKNALGYVLRDDQRTRYVFQPIPRISGAKRESLTVFLRTILQLAEEQRRVATSHRQAQDRSRSLQRQVINLFRLLAGINHNFRGILSAGATEIMELARRIEGEESVSQDQYRRAIKKMAPNIPVLIGLVEGLDDLQSIIGIQSARTQYEAFPLDILFHNSFGSWIERQQEIMQKKVAIEVDIPANLLVLVDSTSFFQIVWNVLSNSFKYTRRGLIHISAHRGADHYVYLVISDTGPGISKDELDHVGSFEFRTDAAQELNGQGIGLWFSKKLLELQAGKMEITSILGEGTTFSVGFQAALVGSKGS